MPKPTRLKDIAQALNVSPGLVSAVLNGKSGPWVSEQTRQRILETAHRMGYHPQAAARSLRLGKTHTVALLYWQNEYVRLEALAQVLAEAGYRLTVYVITDEKQCENTLHEIVRSHAADAVVLWGSERRMDRHGEYLQRNGVKFVLKGRHDSCHPDWHQIDFDHERMMWASVSHLWRLGHRRIGYLGYPLEEGYRQHLLEGYRQAYASLAGHAPPDEWVYCHVNSVEDAERAVEQWFRLPERQQPTAAVITADNEGWHGAELALAKRRRFIGDSPVDFGVSGQCQPSLRLAFGSALAHVNIDLDILGTTLAKELLLPLMEEQEPKSRVIRILPEMTPVDSQLLRYLLSPSSSTYT